MPAHIHGLEQVRDVEDLQIFFGIVAVCFSEVQGIITQSITTTGVKRCGHTHVLHSAYRSQFALCRWDQPSDRTLLFPLDTMISPTEFENPTSDASSGERTQKKRKRGLGKGGAAANYCTMSVASRMAQFPNEPFEERVGSLNQSVMWCLGCGKPVSHQTKTSVKQHVDSQTHQKGKETLKKQKAKREAAATKEKEVPQMRVSTLRQPSLSHVLNIHAERFEVQDDAVFTLLACGIPVEKLNHKIFRAFLRKYTTVEGCLSELGGEFPKHCPHASSEFCAG